MEIIAVILAATLPPIIYLVWLRSAELCLREDLKHVFSAFLVGGTFSLLLAYLIETGLLTMLFGEGGILSRPFWSLDPQDPDFQLVFMACIVAPLVEESTKGWGILFFRNRLSEIENGLVYGAAVGLGFAAFENILYEANAISVGISMFIGTAIARALTSTALHASSSGLMGYGLSRRRLLKANGRKASWVPYFLMAVALHGTFNLLAIAGTVWNSDLLFIIGLLASLILVQQTIRWVRDRIEQLDRTLVCGPVKS